VSVNGAGLSDAVGGLTAGVASGFNEAGLSEAVGGLTAGVDVFREAGLSEAVGGLTAGAGWPLRRLLRGVILRAGLMPRPSASPVLVSGCGLGVGCGLADCAARLAQNKPDNNKSGAKYFFIQEL
jgi:hypothetical protein